MRALDVLVTGSFPAVTLACTIGFLVAGGTIGVVLRRRWLEGQALGLAVLIAASTAALYVSRHLHLSLDQFAILALAIAAAYTLVLRLVVFRQPAPPGVNTLAVVLVSVIMAVVVWSVRLLTPDPQAGFAVYQAWHPLYLDESFARGRLLEVADMAFGHGFLADGSLSYPADTLGLAALAKWLGDVPAHPAYFATTVAATVAALSLLAWALRRSLAALLLFFAAFLVFYRFGSSFRVLLSDNWYDVSLYLGGALTLYYLCAGERARVGQLGAAMTSVVMVCARPYGAMFSALVAGASFVYGWLRPRARQPFAAWLAFAAVLGFFTGREILRLLSGGMFHARPQMTELYPPSLVKSVAGTLIDLGLVPDPSMFRFGLPIGVPILAMLLVLVFMRRQQLRRRPWLIALYCSPLLLVAGPMLVEALTGFRKGVSASKLYIVAVFLFPWYPCFLLARMPLRSVVPAGLVRRAAAAGLVLICAAMLLIVGVGLPPVDRWFERAVASYRENNEDYLTARALRARFSGPREFENLVHRRIVYFYYEPGVGLRHFLGGRFFDDLDFWGATVQHELARAETLEDAVAALGYPNLYVSYPSWRAYGVWIAEDSWKRFSDEIDRLETSPWVQATIAARGARFYVTRGR